ncbi:transporter associated domain-containing protein [Nonomuraea polychroma]|uniref:transporter associated domain-containing protein n=1 Tax=Nonomuraea polychroma TaxID=46176 RepID=UPI003D8CA9D9
MSQPAARKEHAEELVGEIADEHAADTPSTVRRDSGWELDAGLRIDEIALETDLNLPDEDEYDALAGLALHRLGRFAVPGDVITVDLPATLDSDAPTHARIEVLPLNRHVPERVRLTPYRQDGEEQQS